MVADEDEWEDLKRREQKPRPPIFLFAFLLLLGLSLLFISYARAGVLLIVDHSGNELLRCPLPTSYLPAPHVALVCDRSAVFKSGFEN